MGIGFPGPCGQIVTQYKHHETEIEFAAVQLVEEVIALGQTWMNKLKANHVLVRETLYLKVYDLQIHHLLSLYQVRHLSGYSYL